VIEAATTAPSSALHAELERVLSTHFGAAVRIRRLTGQRAPYGSSNSLALLSVEIEAGQQLEIVWKDLSPTAVMEAARGVKPDFLRNPLREIEMYERVLAPRAVGPAFYGSVVDPTIGRYWLFLAAMPGVPLWQIGEFSAWQEAARWLARFHAAWLGAPRLADQHTHLLRCDRAYYRRWLDRLELALARATSEGRLTLRRVQKAYEAIIEQLIELPVSIIHGDFYPANILIQSGKARRVCPVDWELAAVGPHLLDLAALLAGRWTSRQRLALAEAYRAALEEIQGGDLDAAAFSRDLRCCRLFVAVQWLGWSPGWTPPPEQAHDWLLEAAQLSALVA